jgi:muramoyltetrapeptide carboxypeptidase
MKIIKAPRLRRGDWIGVISPAGPVADRSQIERGVRYLEQQGYRVVVGEHAHKTYGYWAGTDEERLADLHAMFLNPEVKAILCVRGGYGISRLLSRLNYRLIIRHPKILVGFSDVTSLQLALWKKCGLVTFHGPMLRADLSNRIDPFTEESFWRLITSAKQPKPYVFSEEELTHRIPGKSVGRLLGGNLSLVVSLLGTPYQPDYREALLFLEEVAEEPYRIDRMLMQLSNAGVLNQISGILTGQFAHCRTRDPSRPSFSVEQVLTDFGLKCGKPFLSGLPFGHVARKMTLPVGVRARLETGACRLVLLESAVS